MSFGIKAMDTDIYHRKGTMSDTLVIIPAFNEEKNIVNVIEMLTATLSGIDYIIINDGSTDFTSAICKENSFNTINLPVNLGLAGAFQTGMKYAHRMGYRFAVQFDGDGQHRPEYIPEMRRRCKDYDIVIVSRFVEKKKPLSLRMIGSRLISFAIRLNTGVMVSDPTSGMRMYNEKLIAEFALRLNYAPEPDTISYLLKQGIRLCEIQGEMDERVAGISYLTPFNAIKYMFRMLSSIMIIQNFREKIR